MCLLRLLHWQVGFFFYHKRHLESPGEVQLNLIPEDAGRREPSTGPDSPPHVHSPPSSPLFLGHSRKDLEAELPTGTLASFTGPFSPQKCLAGSPPGGNPTEVPTCDTHVSWGRRFSHRTKTQSRAEDNDLPQACAAPADSPEHPQQVTDFQTDRCSTQQGARSLPGLKSCSPQCFCCP